MKTKLLTLIIIILATGLNAQRGPNSKDECLVRNLSFKTTTISTTTTTASNPLSPYFIDDDRIGVIELQPFSVSEIGGWNNFTDALSSDTSTTYEYLGRIESNLLGGDYLRYRQLYQGIPIVDGGFTIRVIPNDPTSALSNNPPDPNGDCWRLASISVNVYEEIDVNTNPTFTIGQIQDSLQGTVIQVDSIELKIINNLMGYCDYRLVYEVQYENEEDGSLVAIVDAHSGSTLHYSSAHSYKEAPTADWGPQNMDDYDILGFTFLANDRLQVIDMTAENPSDIELLWRHFNQGVMPKIPISQQSWEPTDADPNVFQAFWMANDIINLYDTDFGVVFEDVRLGVHLTLPGAVAYFHDVPEDKALFAIGTRDGKSMVEYDIIGHELAHSVIRKFFLSEYIESATLHEGIAEMFGTYMEAKLDELDWIGGDDIPAEIKDLANPTYDCFTDVSHFNGQNDQYPRSEPLTHWFYLCVNGDVTNGILPITIEEVMGLVYESLSSLGSNPDYPDLMEVTMDLAEEKYGTCSYEFLTILRAWEQICVPTGHRLANPAATCVYTTGPSWVYEEDDYIHVCLNTFHGLDTDKGRWTIIGPQSTSFASVRGMTGNSQDGGQCITITQIPDYPYYPQRITIQYWNSEYGDFLTRSIIIRDEDQSHPTCEEYYDLIPLANNEDSFEAFMSSMESLHSIDQNSDKELNLIVYDMMGNVLNITEDQIRNQTFGQPRIIILTYWDKDGRLIKSKKKLIR